jgi:sugar phosphate isomerase/epimerase
MPQDQFQLGILSTTFGGDLREAAGLSRRAGFRGMLVPAFSPTFRVTELSTTGQRDVRHILSSQDQQLIGLSVDIGKKGFGPGADVDRILAQMDRVMEAAIGLGSPLVCVELGLLPAPEFTMPPKRKISPLEAGLIIIPESSTEPEVDESTPPAKPDPAFVAQVDAALLELGRRADRYNTMLAFRSDLSSFAALSRALRSADCPWFGVDLDPVAILHDSWSVDEIFSTLGGEIRHVRARDAILGADKRTRPAIIGQGDANWPELLNNLRAADFHGWMTVDPLEMANRVQAATASLELLSKY